MPDLSNKLLKYTSSRYFFVPFVAILFCDLHFRLSKPTLDLISFVTGGGVFKAVDVIVKYSNVWNILKIGYKALSIIGIAITVDLIYSNIFIKLLPKHAKTDELLEIRPPPYPYNEDKLQNGEYKYNPVHKPNMRPLVLANRSKTVLSLFSPRGASDGYWPDKAELLIAECIKETTRNDDLI